MVPADLSKSREWLEAEVERIAISVEYELRRLQMLKLRPPPDSAAMSEIEAVLADRRAQRNSKAMPIELAELRSALGAVMKRLEPLRNLVFPRLLDRLGLSLRDIDCLLLVAAPSIDPPLADLFAAVRGSAMARRGVDVALIGYLLSFGRERIELLEFLDEELPPLSLRLIKVAPTEDVYSSATYRSIQPTLDLLWLLTTSGEQPSPSLRRNAEIHRGVRSWEGMIFDEEIWDWLEPLTLRFQEAATSNPTSLPWVALWGMAGSGKREVASRLAAHAHKRLLAVDPKNVDKANLVDLVRRACRDAAWLETALYLGPLGHDQLLEQPAVISELQRCREPVILGFESTQAPRLCTSHPLGEYALPVPLVPTRLQLWQRELAGAHIESGTDIDTVARGYKQTPGEIIQSAREVVALAGSGTIDRSILRGVMERRLRNELGTVATRLVVKTTWDDVILPPDAVGRVNELIARKHYEDQVYRQWGLDRRIGYGKGIIALFSGPPGTGKTLLAGLIAQELGFELYQVDLSQIFSRWVGETEKALNKVFDQAERAHAVLLFDEADALFAKRTEVTDSKDRYANLAVNFLLQRLERYSGVAVLTTNKDAYLDEALQRRLSLHLQLEEPEERERLRLWQKHLPMTVPGAETVDIKALAAEYELTGGYIKNVAVRAAFLSAAEDTPLSTDLVRRAAILEMEDMGRVVSWFSDFESRPRTLRLNEFDYIKG